MTQSQEGGQADMGEREKEGPQVPLTLILDCLPSYFISHVTLGQNHSRPQLAHLQSVETNSTFPTEWLCACNWFSFLFLFLLRCWGWNPAHHAYRQVLYYWDVMPAACFYM
jgi:hypothetical protein